MLAMRLKRAAEIQTPAGSLAIANNIVLEMSGNVSHIAVFVLITTEVPACKLFT